MWSVVKSGLKAACLWQSKWVYVTQNGEIKCKLYHQSPHLDSLSQLVVARGMLQWDSVCLGIARVKTERVLLRYRTDWLLPFHRPNAAPRSSRKGWQEDGLAGKGFIHLPSHLPATPLRLLLGAAFGLRNGNNQSVLFTVDWSHSRCESQWVKWKMWKQSWDFPTFKNSQSHVATPRDLHVLQKICCCLPSIIRNIQARPLQV